MTHPNVLNPAFEIANRFVNEVIHPEFPDLNRNFLSAIGDYINGISFNPNTRPVPDSSNVHFTEIPNLFSILYSGYFRMSSLKSIEDDPHEFIFAADDLKNLITNKNPEEWVDFYKRNTFCFCMCKHPQGLDNSHLWFKFANDSKGIAIVFKIIHPDHRMYWFEEIEYGIEAKNKLVRIKEQYQDQFKNQLDGEALFRGLIPLFSICKKFKYRGEKEIRMLDTSIKLEDKYNPVDYYFNRSGKKVQFKRVVLEERANELIRDNMWKFYPRIKIEEIILGLDIDSESASLIEKELEEIKINKGYSFSVRRDNR